MSVYSVVGEGPGAVECIDKLLDRLGIVHRDTMASEDGAQARYRALLSRLFKHPLCNTHLTRQYSSSFSYAVRYAQERC